MKFTSALHTDIGLRKKTNQDSLLLQEAYSSQYGEILFAVVCDGMGGLEKGELASAEVIRAMDQWFKRSLPQLLDGGFQPEALQQQWAALIQEQDRRITDYGDRYRLRLGTTLTALLLIGSRYYIVNAGDSRVYMLTDQVYQLTKDHTLVQMEVDQGRLTPEQAEADSRRNVLSQCIGASDGVFPDFFSGELGSGQVFLLCCDGFRHVITPSEMYRELNWRGLKRESIMQERLVQLTELNKERGETDNISAILIRVG